MVIAREDLLKVTDRGLYCEKADVYIDPWFPVERALITHAHGDHARYGMRAYIAHTDTVPLLKARLGAEPDQISGVAYDDPFTINGVKFSLHPAGHVPGSAQVCVEYRGERWVASGDYKVESDGVSVPFEPVRCNVFISESTFGLPIFKWSPQHVIFDQIHTWWARNAAQGVVSVVSAYSLGKAQRILRHLNRTIGPILLHSAVANMCDAISFDTAGAQRFEAHTQIDPSSIVIAPPAAVGSSWTRRFNPHYSGAASGWMAIAGIRRRRGVEQGFVLSDHADFAGLIEAIHATGAERVLLTHGYTAQLARFLQGNGINAHELSTKFGDDAEEGDGSN